MNNIHALAVRIAEKVAPEEVDLAPAIIDAALEGGKQWQDLLKPVKEPELGGIFGGLEAGDLAAIVEMLRLLGDILKKVCSLGSDTLSILVSLLAIRTWRESKEKLQAIPTEDGDKLQETLESMTQYLTNLGIETDRAEELSRLTMQALVEDIEGSKQLLMEFEKRS